MAVLNVVGPQLFADRGGLLGRLLSLRPDLDEDRQNGPQTVQRQTPQMLAQRANDASTSDSATTAIGDALDDFYRQSVLKPAKDFAGYVNDAISDPAYFAHAIGPSLAGLGPIANELPATVNGATGAIRTLGRLTPRSGDSTQDGVERIQSVGRKIERPPEVGGSPEPGVLNASAARDGNAKIASAGLPASTGFRPVQIDPASSTTDTFPSLGSPISGGAALPWLAFAAGLANGGSGFSGRPAQPTAPAFPQANPLPWEDDGQGTLGPAWKLLQNSIDNLRDKGPGEVEEEDEDARNERCRKERARANELCSERRTDDNRHMRGRYESMDDCIKKFMSKDCGGDDPRRPEHFFQEGWRDRRKPGRGGSRKKKAEIPESLYARGLDGVEDVG